MSGMRENGLWAAVIHLAFDDARHPKPHKHRNQSTVFTGDQDCARDWLLGNGSTFRDVCDMAGMNPDYILVAAKALAAQGWPPPEEIKRTRRATA